MTQILEDNVRYGTGTRAALRPAGRGQDRHDRQARRRLVRRLHARPRDRRLDGLPGAARSRWRTSTASPSRAGSFPAEIWRLMMERTIGLRPARDFSEPDQPIRRYQPFQRGPLALSYDPYYVAPTTHDDDHRRTRRPRRRTTRRRTGARRRTPRAGSRARSAARRHRDREAAPACRRACAVARARRHGLPARSPGAPDSPLVPRDGGHVSGTAPLFLVLLVARVRDVPRSALAADPPRAAVDPRRDRRSRPRSSSSRSRRRCCSRPTPGRTGRTGGSRPRAAATRTSTRRRTFPDNPALPYMGSDWRRHDERLRPRVHDRLRAARRRRRRSRTRSPPGRTRRSPRLAALAAALARRPARPAAGVRDRVRRLEPACSRSTWPAAATTTRWVGALILAAARARRASPARAASGVAVGARDRRQVGAARSSSRCAALEARATRAADRARAGSSRPLRRRSCVGATSRYGGAWPLAIFPLAGNAALETSYAIPHRLEQLGLPDDARARARRRRPCSAGLAWLAREARAGPRAARPRGLPRARDDAVPRRLVPRVGGAARGRRRTTTGSRRVAVPRPLRVPAAADDPALSLATHGARRRRPRRTTTCQRASRRRAA